MTTEFQTGIPLFLFAPSPGLWMLVLRELLYRLKNDLA